MVHKRPDQTGADGRPRARRGDDRIAQRAYRRGVTAQLTVTLDRRLIASLKRRALDSDLSLSELVTRICSGYLGEWGHEVPETDDVTADVPGSDRSVLPPGDLDVVLQPMVHVTDLDGTVHLLEALGGEVVEGSRDGDWVQVAIGGAEIGLLAHPPNPEQGEGAVELNFESRTPLERIEQSAHDAGVQIARPTSDEGFGRQLQLRTPDGLLVKLNEIDAALIG